MIHRAGILSPIMALLFVSACGQTGGETVADQPSAEVMTQMSGGVAGGDAHPGAALYDENCAMCHDGSVPRAPHKSFLEMLSGDMILASMSDGIMRQQAAALSDAEKVQVAEFLVGGVESAQADLLQCDRPLALDPTRPPALHSWGMSPENTRFIPGDVAQLPVADVANLEVKWAFGFPRATRARSQVAHAGGVLFTGSQDGTVYALDAESGCVHWTFRATAEVRTGITLSHWSPDEGPYARPLLYFGDLLARVYAVDMQTGELAWSHKVDDHPNATVTAQPILHDGRIYASVSSLEVVPAADPAYPCCSFRGSVVAIDAQSGERVWKSYTIPEEPTEVGRNSVGTPKLAPSGAPVWNSPTVDAMRGLLYVGTGENYSSPADGNSDALMAFELETGAVRWVRQTTVDDAWNLACMPFIPNKTNCPVENGPDFDYGAPPILVRGEDRDVLVGGQKSGMVYGVDPDSGEQLWETRVGRGGVQGGVHFGLAAEGARVFVPMSDYDDGTSPIEDARPGLYALDAFTGELIWSQPADNVCGDKVDCDPGISAAITAIPGIVFAGHLDGRLRAYSAEDGTVLWEMDTDQEFGTVHGDTASGGSFSGGAGPLVIDGVVYVNSGYGLYFHMPGNVLLALAPVE